MNECTVSSITRNCSDVFHDVDRGNRICCNHTLVFRERENIHDIA